MSHHSYPSPGLFRALVCPDSMTSRGLTFHRVLGCILILIIISCIALVAGIFVCVLLERERGILLKRLLNASPGEERTELFLGMCYLHRLEMEAVKETRQKRLEKMCMGEPV
jgi:hypothetical protein